MFDLPAPPMLRLLLNTVKRVIFAQHLFSRFSRND